MLIKKDDFKKLIEKGWSLKKIGQEYKFSTQTGSNFFKKFYSINYREYKKRLKPKQVFKEYEDDDVQKVFELEEREKTYFIKTLKKMYATCKSKDLKIRVKLVNDIIKEVWANEKIILFREYILKGNTSEEKRGFYRFRPPGKMIYGILIVALIKGKSCEYFIIPRDSLFPKKSVCLPLSEKQISKYSVYINNWEKIFL